MSGLPPILVELKANAGEFMTKMGEARHEVAKLETEAAGHVHQFSAVGKAALLGFAGVAVGVGTIAVKAALEGQKSHAALAQAIKNTGGSIAELEPRISRTSDFMAKWGFTNDQVESGLAALTTGTGSATTALHLIRTAADLAALKHVDLATASIAVAKASEGNLKPLKQLGIDLPIAAGGAKALAQAHTNLATATEKLATFVKIHKDALDANSKSHGTYLQMVDKVHSAQEKLNTVQGASTSIMDALTHRIGGQAAAAANTYAGKLEATKAQAENLAEKLGNHLLPIIAQVITKTTEVVGWLERHKTTAEILAGVIGGVLALAIATYIGGLVVAAVTTAATTVAMTAGTVRMGARIAVVYAETAAAAVSSAVATAAAWVAANAAMLLAGGAIILALVAIGVAAYELYKHWDQVWGFIKEVVRSAVDFVKTHLALIITVVFGPLGLALYELYKHWDQVWGAIKTATAAVIHAIVAVFDDLVHAGLWVIKTELHALEAVWSAVWKGVTAVAQAEWAGIKAVFDALVHLGLWLVKNEINGLELVWRAVWGGLHLAVDSAWRVIKPIIDLIRHAIDDVSSALSTLTGAAGKIGSIGGGILHHIPGFASGVQNFGGGLALVGERGPELLELPRGANVYPSGTGPSAGPSAGVELTYAPVIHLTGATTVTPDDVQRILDDHSRELVRELAAGRN